MRRLAILLVVLLLLRCGVRPEQALIGEENVRSMQEAGIEKVLFADRRDGLLHLYVLDSRSIEARRITAAPASRFGVWSPDGRRIAYVEWAGNTSNSSTLNVMKEDGAEVRQLVNYPSGPRVSELKWSPDGSHIAFGVGSPSTAISVIRADGAGLATVEAVSASVQSVGDFAWSPDGKRLAYAARHSGDADAQIYLVNADGTEKRRLTSVPSGAWGPSWSPDGKKIVFAGRTGIYTTGIYTIQIDGTGQKRVLESALGAVWSPRGDAIAHTSGGGGLGIVNPDGSGQSRIVNWDASWSIGSISWSPDGSRITFTGRVWISGDRGTVISIPLGRQALYVVAVAGGEPRLLLDDIGWSDVKWSR
jgi:Tol biopolymer transport system component